MSGAWQAIDTRYYRYYKPEETHGAPDGIKFVFGPQAFENLRVATSNDPFHASDGVALLYADNYYKYDESVRVIEEQINGGSQTTLMAYERDPILRTAASISGSARRRKPVPTTASSSFS